MEEYEACIAAADEANGGSLFGDGFKTVDLDGKNVIF